jgi:uncharacterized protein YycO
MAIPPLDPAHVARATQTFTPNFRLEPRVREFGYFPDTDALLPGDLILTQDLPPDWISRGIEQAQIDAGFPAEHCRWTHAAMYLGDGERVVESTFGSGRSGVQISPLGDYVGTHLLRFRRPRDLSERQRWMMVVEAVSLVTLRYDFGYLWNTFWQTRTGFWQRRKTQRDVNRAFKINRARVCSTLYADAFTRISGEVVDSKNDAHIPATLSQSDVFDDVIAGWRKLV